MKWPKWPKEWPNLYSRTSALKIMEGRFKEEQTPKAVSKFATFIKVSGHEDSFINIDPVKLLVLRLVDTEILLDYFH